MCANCGMPESFHRWRCEVCGWELTVDEQGLPHEGPRCPCCSTKLRAWLSCHRVNHA